MSINYTGLQKDITLGFLQHIVNLLFCNKEHSNFLSRLTEINFTESVLLLLNNQGRKYNSGFQLLKCLAYSKLSHPALLPPLPSQKQGKPIAAINFQFCLYFSWSCKCRVYCNTLLLPECFLQGARAQDS